MRTITVIISIAILAVAGVMVWAGALTAVGQYTEDLCFDDLEGRAGYGAYRSESVLWPPSHECRLLGSGVEAIVVQHRAVALARLAAVVAVPVPYVASATVSFVIWSRRRRRGGAHPTTTLQG